MLRSARLTGIALTGTALLLSGGSAAASNGSHSKPVYRTAPITAPKTSDVKGTCTTPEPTTAAWPNTTKRLLWVNAHPTSLTAIWLPGLNAKPCTASRTVSGARLAGRLAAALQHAPAFPPETFWCPADDNASVRLYFGYRGGRYEYADVALGGCRPISAPGRAARWNDSAVTNALRPAAPRAWQVYLGGSTSSAGHGAPVLQEAPSSAPTSSTADGRCTTPGVTPPPPSTDTEPLLWVDPNPTAITAVWLPGLDSADCRSERTVGDADLAAAVASAIEQAKAFPLGALPCPFDDNTSVRLYFSYASGGDEYADVSLSGCRPIFAPDRASRWIDDDVEAALRPAAPDAWKAYLGS